MALALEQNQLKSRKKMEKKRLTSNIIRDLKES